MKRILTTFAFLGILLSGLALAELQGFTQATFDALQKEGKPLLVHVHAKWCSTCRAQEPIIDSLLKEKEFAGLTALRVDYDDQKRYSEIIQGEPPGHTDRVQGRQGSRP